MTEAEFDTLLRRVRRCQTCKPYLPLGPRPVVQAHPSARLLIVGQAPGIKVHETGIPWNDASGDRLREWLGLSREDFYDPRKVAILPVGFCYPGTGEHGDLPPRPECFKLWHEPLLNGLPDIELTVLLGSYAHKKYLGKDRQPSLTATVRAWREYLPRFLPLPHPSPLNNIWLSKNPWFNREVLPALRRAMPRGLGKR
jgi:uracil-DNA glycosylase